jgi:hypothetical protein
MPTGKIFRADVNDRPAWSTATYPDTAGTSGKILISDGTNIVSSTPTYPNAASTSLKHIKSDGTNFVTTTVTYPDAAVTAGKVIVSDGSNYIASTPTFPNASATSGKVIKSDGTNWVASTETYAAPGTSGNVMTSDGTNWTSAAPSASTPTLTLVSLTLTSAQIKALHATPIQIIAAPGVGKTISIVHVTRAFNYGGSNVFTAAASQTIELSFNSASTIGTIVTNALIVGSASSAIAFSSTVELASSVANAQNKNVTLYNPVVTEIGGNAANNNTVTVSILYYIFTN